MINAARIVSLQGKWPRQNRPYVNARFFFFALTFFVLLKKQRFCAFALPNAFSLRTSSRYGVINQHKLCNSAGEGGGRGAREDQLAFLCVLIFLFLYLFCLFYLFFCCLFLHRDWAGVGDKSRSTEGPRASLREMN